MGTTESTLYDTAPTASPPDDKGARTTSPDGVQAPPSNLQHPGAGRRRSGGGGSASSSSGRPRRPHAQRRTRTSNLLTLKGVLLGLPSSGKRTLLERLEGRDPFVQTTTTTSTEPRSTEITVPYQQPPSVTVWDRIQLQAEISHSIDDDHKVDFAVVLVNPRHNPRNIRHYIEKIVTSLLQQAGYTEHPSEPKDETVSDEDDDEGESQNHTETPPLRAQPLDPLCICLLLNFRDLRCDDSDKDEPDDERLLQDESELKTIVEQVLTQLYPTFAEEKRVVIQCGTTSLLNCYGLSTLHHFIYQSYLQRKQADCERQLRNVRREIDLSNQAVPRVSYGDHLKLTQPPLKQQHEARTSKQGEDRMKQKKGTRPKRKEEKQSHRKGGKSHTNGREEVRPVDHEPKDLSDEEDSQKEQVVVQSKLQGQRRRMLVQQEPNHPRRTVLPSSYHEDSKTALDAFFADDDDEYVVPAAQQKKKTHNESSSDEDDNDFYYDEGGHRRGHNPLVFSYDDSSSSEEEEISPPWPRPTTQTSQPTKKRPNMPSISESSSHEEEPHPEDNVVEKSNTDKVQGRSTADNDKKSDNKEKLVSETESSNAKVGTPPPEKATEPQASPQDPAETPGVNKHDSSTDTKEPEHANNGNGAVKDYDNGTAEKSKTVERKNEPVDESSSELEVEQPIVPEKTTKESKAVQQDKESRTRKDINGSDSKRAADPVTNNRNGPVHASAPANDYSSSSDGEFVVEAVVRADNSIGANTAPKRLVTSRTTEDTPQEEPSSGEKVAVSSAALAAIAAAQREAERMLEQNVKEPPLEKEAPPKSRTKKSKKKKKEDPEKAEKREKKKKKKSDKERRANEVSQEGGE